MNEEFENLYKKLYDKYALDSTGRSFLSKEFYDLLHWCEDNHDEALKCIERYLELEPDIWLPSILAQLMPIQIVYSQSRQNKYLGVLGLSNLWLNILKHTEDVDYYKEYREYHEYLADHYISWNPFKEKDPNITLEEFRKGKRNDITRSNRKTSSNS